MDTKQNNEAGGTKGRVNIDDMKPEEQPVKDLSGSEQQQVIGGQRPKSKASDQQEFLKVTMHDVFISS